MRPRTSISWTAFLIALVAAVSSASAQPLISSPVTGTRGLDPEAALTLAWTTVPNATSYTVELSENMAFMPPLPLQNAQVKAVSSALGQTYVVAFTDGTTLEPGRTYYWRVVTAVEGGGTLTSSVATFSTVADPFAALASHGVSLTRVEDGVDKDKPAAIGFIRQGGAAPSQQVFAEFLVGWAGPERFLPRTGPFSLAPSVGFAGKMSSDKENEDTLAKVAGGVITDLSFGDTVIHSVYQTFDIAYEGNQAFDEANLTFNYLVTYSGPVIGRFLPRSAAVPAQILVRPYLLAVVVDKEDERSEAPENGQTRVGPQFDVKLRLNVISRALGISQTLLSLTDRYIWLDGYHRDTANYFTASLDFTIAKGLTIGYAYKHGYDAPAFKGVTRQALTIGIGFGQ